MQNLKKDNGFHVLILEKPLVNEIMASKQLNLSLDIDLMLVLEQS